MKGNQCGFLHQFDKQRMPTCRFFAKYNECKEPDCPFKHSLEDVKDCNMFKLGFCIHGPNCRYRHARNDGTPPDPREAALFGTSWAFPESRRLFAHTRPAKGLLPLPIVRP